MYKEMESPGKNCSYSLSSFDTLWQIRLHLNALSLTVVLLVPLLGAAVSQSMSNDAFSFILRLRLFVYMSNQNGSKVVKLWEINSVCLLLKMAIPYS